MKTISIINHKGGVGKTTSAANIGAYFAGKGHKTLLVDLDSQCNLTQHFGYYNPTKSIYHAFADKENGKLPIMEINDKLFIVPSSREFEKMNTELVGRISWEAVLKRLLSPMESLFDYCLIDCPPSLGLITQNALVASRYTLIPIEAEFFSFNGIKSIVSALNEIKKVGHKLDIAGVFMTKYDKRKVISKTICKEVEEFFGSIYINTPVRDNIALSEAQSDGKDIFSYAPKSHGAIDYKKICDTLIKTLNHD